MVFRNLLKPYFKNAMKLAGKPNVFRGGKFDLVNWIVNCELF
jgi:hypothetical protein